MSFSNVPPSDRAKLAAAIDPQSATTAKTSDYVRMGQGGFAAALLLIQGGAFASGAKLNAKAVQAKDSSGTDAKDITGKAITELAEASANKQAQINVYEHELDQENGFGYVALVETPSVGDVLISGAIYGLDAGYEPADAVASLAETID